MAAAAIVIDIGSGYIKAGLSHNAEPTCVFPSLVGKPRRRYQDQYPGSPRFTGEEAVEARQQLSLFYPVDHGHISDWTLMDELWNHVFLPTHGFNPEISPVLVTQPPMASRIHQRKILETLFDIYCAKDVTLQTQSVLSLYAAARSTGIVVEVGEGVTQIATVIDGQPIREATRRIDCGGQELTMYLQKLFCNNGFSFTTRDEFEYVRLIKESYCYVSMKPDEDFVRDDIFTTFTLPDGFQLRDGTKQVKIGPEKYYCPEALFDPSLIEKDHPPLPELVVQSFQRAPIDTRTELLENIILAGGSTLFRGLKERMSSEIVQCVPPATKSRVNVTALENGVYAAWQGGKLFGDLKSNESEAVVDSWVSYHEWQELGDSLIERFKTI